MKKHLFKGASGMSMFLFIFGILLVLMPGAVSAQEEAYEEYLLEDTVVTATKTGETLLQETNIAVTVFDDQMLADRATFNLEELLQFSASADVYSTLSGLTGGIRGVTASTVFLVGENPVAFYLDGVFLLQGRGGNADFLDVERIEVLRGPQGVTWGGNATGGAINIITKKPSDELELTAYVEVGNYAKRRVDFMISGPVIKDKMNVRLSVSDSMRDGLIDNLFFEDDIKDENYHAFRGSVQILPSDNVEIMIRGDYAESVSNPYYWAGKLLDFNGPIGQLAQSLGYSQEHIIPSDFWTMTNDVKGGLRLKDYGGSAEITIDFPNDVTLVSLTSVRHQKEHLWGQDNDRTAISELYTEWWGADEGSSAEWWAQELRLNGSWGDLDWLVGGSYMDQDMTNGIGGGWGPVEYSPYTGLPPGPWFYPAGSPYYYGNIERKGIFANLTYAFTDKLSGTAGVRYSDESNQMYLENSISSFLPNGMQVPLFTLIATDDASWTAWTPRVGVNYKVSEDLFLYVKAEKGWRSGTIHPENYFFKPPGEGFPLDPEEVWLYEVGIKSDWLDKRLRVNAAVFTNDYEDIVISSRLPSGTTEKNNAGTADINGVEIEAVARPTKHLTLNGAVTYLDATYGSAMVKNRAGEHEDLDGHTVENAPEWKAVLGANYVVPLDGNGFLSFLANIAYRDAVHWYLFDNDPTAWVDDYTIVNASVRYETEDGDWTLEAYGKNIFETKYYHKLTIETGNPDGYGLPGDPMTMGIKVIYRY